MLRLDHLTVIAPTLAEGVAHVRACLDLEVPFGQRHAYMGTHNHLLQLGGGTYLEIVALDPDADCPARRRWFGLDDQERVRRDWEAGHRLRGWVAGTDDMDGVLRRREAVFGRKVALPMGAPSFDFAIPDDGSLPWDGAAPSIIDRRGTPRSMAAVAELGAPSGASPWNIRRRTGLRPCCASWASTGRRSSFRAPSPAIAPRSRRRAASGSSPELPPAAVPGSQNPAIARTSSGVCPASRSARSVGARSRFASRLPSGPRISA